MSKMNAEATITQASSAISEFISHHSKCGQDWLRQIKDTPILLSTSLMFHRPEFFTAAKIRGSLIPFCCNAQYTSLSQAQDVEYLQNNADKYSTQWYWFKPRNFHRMRLDQQTTEIVSMLIGYNWDALRDDLYQSDKAILNHAVILGFMCKQLLFAESIEAEFKRLWVRYQETTKAGVESDEHSRWLKELQADEFSTQFRCSSAAMHYGTVTSQDSTEYEYYERFGYPYCCRPQIDKELQVTPMLRTQEAVGFTKEYLEEAAKLHQAGVSTRFLYNTNIRARLLRIAAELTTQLIKAKMQPKEIDYVISGILHPEFNGLRTETIHRLAMQPFRERIQQEYNSLSEISELLIESNNAVSSLGKASYLDNILRNMASKSANQISSINLIRDNQDILEYMLGGMYYFANISEFMTTVQRLRKMQEEENLNIEQVLDRIIRLQRLILSRIDITKKQGWQLTLQERGVLMLIPETSKFSLEFLDSLQMLVTQCGVDAAMRGYDIATEMDNGSETDKLFKTIYDFTRLSYAEYGEILELAPELELTDIGSLVTLLQLSIDVRKLTKLDSQAIGKFSRILYSDPSAIDLITDSSDPNELQLMLLSKMYGATRFPDRELAEKYKDSAPQICRLVEEQRIDLESVKYFPTQPVFWEAVGMFSKMCNNIKGALTTKALLDKVIAAIPLDKIWVDYDLTELHLSRWANSEQVIQIQKMMTAIANAIEQYEIKKAPFRAAFMKKLDTTEVKAALTQVENALHARISAGARSIGHTGEYAEQLHRVGQEILHQFLGLTSKHFNSVATDCFALDAIWVLRTVEIVIEGMSPETRDQLTSHFDISHELKWLNGRQREAEKQMIAKGTGRLLSKYNKICIEVEW